MCAMNWNSGIKKERDKKRSVLLAAAAVLLTAAGTTFLSLTLAFWTGQRVIFRSYFDRPLVLLLNFLPVLLLQLLLAAVTGRQWVAFLLTALPVFLGGVGNFFKMSVRSTPFVVSDLAYLRTAFGVAGNYSFRPNSRMWIFLAYIIGAALVLFLLRRRLDGGVPLIRVSSVVLLTVLGAVLWKGPYSSKELYTDPAICTEDGCTGINGEIREYITKGFVYPLIYSVGEYMDTVPKNYSREQAAALLEELGDSPIPEDKKVNVIVFQLESFTDLRRAGIKGISEDAYGIYDGIREESLHGNMVVSVFGGGTIETEHSVLTGDHRYFQVEQPALSYPRYFVENGYAAVGGHPMETYYDRNKINGFLGFESYRFSKNGFYMGKNLKTLEPDWWYSDSVFFPSVLEQYRTLTGEGKNVFSFNVTMQGHGQYSEEELLFEGCYDGGDYTGERAVALGNYLGSLRETQKYMKDFLDALREDEEPCVVVFYGDHVGDFTNGNTAELIGLDPNTRTGHYRMFSTEYLIWANDAAEAVTGKSVSGAGPAISPNYLLPLLFSELGWEGDSYTKYLQELMVKLPVVTSNGFYVENGVMTFQLSDEGKEKLNEYKCVEIYRNRDYGPAED